MNTNINTQISNLLVRWGLIRRFGIELLCELVKPYFRKGRQILWSVLENMCQIGTKICLQNTLCFWFRQCQDFLNTWNLKSIQFKVNETYECIVYIVGKTKFYFTSSLFCLTENSTLLSLFPPLVSVKQTFGSIQASCKTLLFVFSLVLQFCIARRSINSTIFCNIVQFNLKWA